jgi:hypothetical protein
VWSLANSSRGCIASHAGLCRVRLPAAKGRNPGSLRISERRHRIRNVPPGEIALAQLAPGTGSSNNPIATLEIPINNTPTQSEFPRVLAQVHALIR